jgi:hypothetical protein
LSPRSPPEGGRRRRRFSTPQLELPPRLLQFSNEPPRLKFDERRRLQPSRCHRLPRRRRLPVALHHNTNFSHNNKNHRRSPPCSIFSRTRTSRVSAGRGSAPSSSAQERPMRSTKRRRIGGGSCYEFKTPLAVMISLLRGFVGKNLRKDTHDAWNCALPSVFCCVSPLSAEAARRIYSVCLCTFVCYPFISHLRSTSNSSGSHSPRLPSAPERSGRSLIVHVKRKLVLLRGLIAALI